MSNVDKHYRIRYKLWISAFIQVAFLAGATYGWANLEAILKRAGYWTNDPSTERTNYGLVYTIGSWFNQAGGVFVGVYLDAFGVRVTTVTGCLMSSAGLIVLALSDISLNLIFPAFVLISLGGPAIQLSTQSVSKLFENKAMVMSSLIYAFQLSTLWFMLCNVLNEDGVNDDFLFSWYAVMAAFLGVWCYCLYPKSFINLFKLADWNGGEGDRNYRGSMLVTTGRYERDFLETGSMWEMMFSVDYILLNVWYSTYVLFLNFYLMTIGSQTEHMTGDNMAVEFTICLCTVGASAIGAGYCIDKFGFGKVVLVNVGFSVGALILLCMKSVFLQWIGFILYVLARVTTYSTFFSFIGINFGFNHFGTLASIGLLISGCFSLFQYLLLDIVVNNMGGDYRDMNVFLAIWCSAWGGLYSFLLLGMEIKSKMGKSADDVKTGTEKYVIDNTAVKV